MGGLCDAFNGIIAPPDQSPKDDNVHLIGEICKVFCILISLPLFVTLP